MEKNDLYRQLMEPELLSQIHDLNERLQDEFEEYKDKEVIAAIDQNYTEKIAELEALYKVIPGKKLGAYVDMNSVLAHLWKDQKDLTKRVIFAETFKNSCVGIEPAIQLRIMKRMEDSHGQKEIYPKPYL